MNTTFNILVTVAALIILGVAIAVIVSKVSKAREVQEDAEYRKSMEEGLRLHKDRTYTLKANSGRITVRILNYKFQYFNVPSQRKGEHVTYTSLQALFDAEELDPAEVRELQAADEALGDIRHYQAQLQVRPQGFTTHVLPHVTLHQFFPGTMQLCDTRRVCIDIVRNSDGTLAISEIAVSVNLLQHPAAVFQVSTSGGKELFEREFLKNTAMRPEYEAELSRYEEIEKQIEQFNQHVDRFVFDVKKEKILSYRFESTTPTGIVSDKYRDVPVV